jgi:hypothetical protein
MASTSSALPFLLTLGLLAGPALAQRDQRITPNDVAKKKGYKLHGLQNADIDGDGKPESVAACDGKKGLRICVFGENAKGATWKAEGPWARGKIFKKLVAKDLVKDLPGKELIFELYDETPDEKVKRIRVYAGKPKLAEIFQSVIYRSKSKSDRAAWEQPGVVKYGDARAGWYFADTNDDGNVEVIVRRKPNLRPIPTNDDDVKVLLGVKEAVFRYQKDSGKYVEDGDGGRYKNFIPGYEIASVRASSTWVPKEVMDDLKAEAIAEQMAKETAKEVDVNLAPFTEKAIDKDLDTGWIEDKKGNGKGEWIEVRLAERQKIHMVRIVAGCVESKRSFMNHNIPTRFELSFDGGEKSLVDMYKALDPDRPAVGIQMLPIKDRKFAKQTLVFFNGKFEAKRIKLTIDGVKRLGRGNRTCISEISVH